MRITVCQRGWRRLVLVLLALLQLRLVHVVLGRQ
jgi:hypothetical protein